MNERERVATGLDDGTAGRATTSAPRGGWRRWCLLLAATAAATLLGPGASQAQELRLSVDTSSTPTYPNPLVAYSQINGGALKLRAVPAFAYCPTTASYTWGGGGLSTTCGSATTASTTPALVPQTAPTSTLRGAAATTSSAALTCPADTWTATPLTLTGILRYANQYGYTSGIRIICSATQPGHSVWSISFAAIGERPAGQTPTRTECAAGTLGFGFNVGTGAVMDNVSLECAVTGSHSATPILGPGVRTGTALCPKGYALTGLQGLVNDNWFNSVNVIGLTGICTQYPGNAGLGAAGGGVLAYKGTSPKGAVKFSVAPKQGTAVGAEKSGWDYTLGGFRFAKSCSRASAKVPGKVAVFGRENAGKPTPFSLTSGRFSITGKLSGKLSKPKVGGRLKILSGACKGRTLRFTATASR
jgi:hypothetical protein